MILDVVHPTPIPVLGSTGMVGMMTKTTVHGKYSGNL
jgi:hypothetical protein